jgi:hypothetical protein
LLAPENYGRFRQRAATIRTSAVYEIPDLLERILTDGWSYDAARIPA